MNRAQIALIVRDAVRQAAREFGVLPSQAHKPTRYRSTPAETAARNAAIRLAFDQGVHPHILADAFGRDVRTIRDAIRLTASR